MTSRGQENGPLRWLHGSLTTPELISEAISKSLQKPLELLVRARPIIQEAIYSEHYSTSVGETEVVGTSVHVVQNEVVGTSVVENKVVGTSVS